MQIVQQNVNKNVSGSALGVGLPQLTLVGEHVKSLHESLACGRVTQVFGRCAYAQFEDKLICIGLHELGASSITALLSDSVNQLPASLSKGSCLQFSEASLFANQHPIIALDNMALYRTPLMRLPAVNQRLLSQTFSQVNIPCDGIPIDGLAPLLNENVQPSVESERLISYVNPSVQALLLQIRRHCFVKDNDSSDFGVTEFGVEVKEFESLFGAGPGLTPSGDDFFAGLLSALHVSGRDDVALSLWQSSESAARSRTTPISYALLEQAARGELSQHLSSVVTSVIASERYSSELLAGLQPLDTNNHDRISASNQLYTQIAQQLSKVGHTSGWDWFAGFILGLRELHSAHY